MTHNNQKGFTLVEIAIVMVIIGLLLGGVLKGQELITNAKFKKIATLYNGITAATYSYQDRYGALPGDDDKAAGTGGHFAELNPSDNGDGLGSVSGNFDSATDADESRLFFKHLRASGLLKGGSADNSGPVHPLGGVVGVQNAALGFTGLNVCFGNLAYEHAIAIDRQNDDGIGTSGSVRASQYTGIAAGAGTGAGVAYAIGGHYNVCFDM
jgi:prepilin-type N-terminal cleavage/methylation domain-containing protein